MPDGFTPLEDSIMNHLTEAHNSFIGLDDIRLDEWIISLHNLQRILSMRILRRDYPYTFNTPKKQ